MTVTEMFAAMRWSPEERAEFRARFPRLYSDVEVGDTWALDGASVGRGWKALLERVFTIAEREPKVQVGQVKEKWASLRVYLEYVPEGSELARVVEEVEAESQRTCEACGNVGDLACVLPNFVKTVCIEHLPDGASYLPSPPDDLVV